MGCMSQRQRTPIQVCAAAVIGYTPDISYVCSRYRLTFGNLCVIAGILSASRSAVLLLSKQCILPAA